jgi:hypothetical protein
MATYKITIEDGGAETTVLSFESEWLVREGLTEWLQHEIDAKTVVTYVNVGYLRQRAAELSADLSHSIRNGKRMGSLGSHSTEEWMGEALYIMTQLAGLEFPTL